MKFITILFLLVCIPSYSQNSDFHTVDVVSSNFLIKGQTNVNRFECEMDRSFDNQKLVVRSSRTDRVISFDGLRLCYTVNGFECAIKAMSKDLQKTLNAEEFPCLHLQINEIVIAEDAKEIENLDVKANVTVSLAGVTRDAIIEDGQVINHSENSLTLKGSKLLLMTDFEIEPPTKFLGLIRVTNELEVQFEIRLNTQPIK